MTSLTYEMEQVDRISLSSWTILIMKQTTIVIESFDKQITQMSTPLRPQANNELVKGDHSNSFISLFEHIHTVSESLSNELDREIEHELQTLNTTTTVKHVTIKEPVVRPSVSVDDFVRTNKTVSGKFSPQFRETSSRISWSDCLSSTTDTTRDLNMLHNAYKQNLNSISTTRTSRSQTFDPKKKIQPQKPTMNKPLQVSSGEFCSEIFLSFTEDFLS